MTKQKIQNWRGIATMVGLTVGTWLAKKAVVALKPEYERRKAQLEDYLDKKNHGIETNYQEHGFNVKMMYVKSDGGLGINYSYEDKLSGPQETLSLTKEFDGESLETILVRNKKRKVTVTRTDREGMILESDSDPKEKFEDIYAGANLGKYEQRWILRMALKRNK